MAPLISSFRRGWRAMLGEFSSACTSRIWIGFFSITRTTAGIVGHSWNRPAVIKRDLFSCFAKMRHDPKKLTIDLAEVALRSARDFYGIGQKSIEYGLEFGGRRRDHPKNLTGRRLVLQCLSQVAVPFLQFFKQPHVLDRDDCLICEVVTNSISRSEKGRTS